MSRHIQTAMLGLAVFPIAAVGIAVYLVAAGRVDVPVIAVAILVLAFGAFAAIAVVTHKLSTQEEWLWHQQDTLRSLADKTEAMTARIDEAEDQIKQPALKLDLIMADVRALRDGFRNILPAADKPQQPRRESAETALKSAPPPAAAASPPPRSATEHLELLLEPVIELATGNTSHYRALLDLTDDQGHVVRHAELMAKADKGGMRPVLDAHMVKLVAPVLRRLRVKNPSLRAFVPIGIATLGSREETARIAASLERDADIAGGIVFEFNHRDLGALETAGIENLARLGRLGATMALSQVQIAGLDLTSLRQLGVRFLTFPPNAADSGFGPTPAWREFVQYARAMQFQIVVSDITIPQQASDATQIARFGYGSFFAPPRRVRSNAGFGPGARRASAA
jgi:EAL domain-containing protein (putative c-di-GMP-specific phosphodiesterase class I)